MFNIKRSIIVSSTILFVATLFFVFCGDEGTPDYCGDGHPLNSVTQFCHNGETHDKCGGQTYNPDVRFCHDQTLYDRCEGGIYNPAERFCYGNIQYPLCEGTTYNPTTHGCHFDVLRPRCGVSFYDPSFQFCYNNTPYVLCNCETYTPPNNPCGDNRYTLTTNISPEDGGRVTRRPNQTNYEPGTEISLTATSETGYRFTGWTDAPTYVNTTNASITVIIPTSDLEMTANFIRRYTLTVDRNLTVGGNVSVDNGSNNPRPATYDEGTKITVSATANSGYRFVSWSGASESTNSTVTIEITGDLTLTANFIQTHTLSVSSSGGSIAINGTTTTSNTTLDDGSEVTLTVTTSDGYEFVNWTVLSGSLPTDIDMTSLNITFNISDNVNIRADFLWITTHGTFTDERDGQTYRTVVMPDGKTWMAENLNFETSAGSWCYDNETSNCDIYGRLYNWITTMNIDTSYSSTFYGTESCGLNCWNPASLPHRGVCPSGWHLPSDAEWMTLVNFVGSNAGTKLKSETGWFSDGNHNLIPGTDDFGFSALPGGYRSPGGYFWNIGLFGHWWTATEGIAWNAWYWTASYYLDGVSSSWSNYKSLGQSVRCVKDD